KERMPLTRIAADQPAENLNAVLQGLAPQRDWTRVAGSSDRPHASAADQGRARQASAHPEVAAGTAGRPNNPRAGDGLMRDAESISKGSLPAMSETHPEVADALAECRRAFWGVALFSGMVNVLMLAGPLYMLQIYDRVLASRSVPTLIALSIFL